jgi:hypothetical protein
MEVLTELLLPFYLERRDYIRSSGDRFAYYTTADTAYNILANGEMWLRNSQLMNDFSEGKHGEYCLAQTLQAPAGIAFGAALDSAFPGISQEIPALVDELLSNARGDTYLTCFSEHLASEDTLGRLSMWRAYGGRTGVALVINGAVMHSRSMVLGVIASPVLYADQKGFEGSFARLAAGLASNTDLLLRVGRERVKAVVAYALRFAILCTKHPGFREEAEWRAIASPSLITTPRLRSAIELVRGVPQTVLKIDLVNDPASGLVGLAPTELLSRIIIGPCAHPEVTARAFATLLVRLGFDEPWSHIAISDTPLRYDA